METRLKFLIVSIIFICLEPSAAMSKDLDLSGNGKIDLSDVIIGLQIMVGLNAEPAILLEADVNGDGRIGLEEIICALNMIAGNIAPYEDDNSPDKASLMIVNGSERQHRIYQNGDQDWFVFYGVKDESYVIEAKNFEPVSNLKIELYDKDGITLKQSSDYYGDGKSEILIWAICEETEAYYIRMTYTISGALGISPEYALSVKTASAPVTLGGIVGYVYSLSPLRVIPGATVQVNDGMTAYSNSSGIYYVYGLENKAYTLTVSAPGYSPRYFSVMSGNMTIRKDLPIQ